MSWDSFSLALLTRAAAGGFVILTVAAAAVRICHQPADRVRIASIGLLGAILVPWVALIPGFPRLSIPVLRAEPVSDLPAPVLKPVVASATEPIFQANLNPINPRTEQKSGEVALLPPVVSQVTETLQEPFPHTTFAPVAPSAEVAPLPTLSWTFTCVLLVTYGTATACCLLWLLIGLWRLVLLRRGARSAPLEIRAILREIAGPASDRTQLLVSTEINAPIAFGGWAPFIVLPSNVCEPDASETLRYALAHEWSHIERGDVWRWYLIALAQVFLFYQPLFWWLRRQVRLSQDFLADARSANQASEPVDYAEYLVSLARRRLRLPLFALGITDRRSNLTRRVHMLLLNRSPLSRQCRLVWTCSSAAVILCLLIGLSALCLTAADPPTRLAKSDETKKPADPVVKAEALNYTGKVTDKDTGKAIAGVTVTVRRSVLGDPERKESNPILEESKHTTDADGKYSFTIPPEQTALRYLYIELDVEHPEYAPQKGFGYALSMIRKNEKIGGRPFFESVGMRPAKPVTGMVRTPDGKPAAGIKILAHSVTSKRENGSFEYGSFADTRTDEQGNFRLPVATPGWAVVWVLPQEYVPTTHVLIDKRGDLGTFTLAVGQRLKGKLLDAKGKPLASAIVNAESLDRNDEITQPVADNINRSTVTNEKGEFVMKPLPPGNYLVKPGVYQQDGSIDRKDAKRGEMPGVFIGTKVTLQAGSEPEPIEVRAVPHVTIKAQHYDSKGKPTRGHGPHIFGQIDGVNWFGEAKIDANGKVVAQIPHGLENTQLTLVTNEHGVLRWRKGKDGQLNNDRRVMLGTMNDDVKDIEIIKYTAPILMVKVTSKDGTLPVKLDLTAVYSQGMGQIPKVSFEKQEDGRFRSFQLLPDEELVVTVHGNEYAYKTENVELAEGAIEEIEIKLEKAPAENSEKNDK
jgi:beta-lactamase regulating signal transducer with metallopeptidase domain